LEIIAQTNQGIELKLGFFIKSTSVKFSIGGNSFKLQVKKSGRSLATKLKIVNGVQVDQGYTAKVQLLDQERRVVNSSEINHFKMQSNLEIGNNSIRKITIIVDFVLSDFFIICQHKTFPCHKDILAEKSPVFERMLSRDNFTESQTNTMRVEDFDSETLENMLHFIYSQQLHDDECCLTDLLLIADKYDIKNLSEFCQGQIAREITLKNFNIIFELTTVINSKHLQDKVVTFMGLQWKNIREMGVFQEAGYKRLLSEWNCKQYTYISQQILQAIKENQSIYPYINQILDIIEMARSLKSLGKIVLLGQKFQKSCSDTIFEKGKLIELIISISEFFNGVISKDQMKTKLLENDINKETASRNYDTNNRYNIFAIIL
jgi:hypothetical protein